MARVRGEAVERGPVRYRSRSVEIPLTLVVTAWLLRRFGLVVVWLVRHPAVAVPGLLLVTVWRVTASAGPLPLLVCLAVLGLLAAVWWRRWPDGFKRSVWWRLRGYWRHLAVYRFGWHPAMVTTGLGERLGDKEYLPRLLRVRSSGSVDLVTVRLLPGQVVTDWADNAERLARTFGAVDCRVRSHNRRRDRLVLWFLVRDPLTEVVGRIAPDEVPDLASLRVALREDGLWYRLQLLGTHVLIAGATGAGKGSVLWSIVAALASGIRSGLVQVWALDPKGGMELALGRGLFARFCYGGRDRAESSYETAFAELLEDALEVMRARQERLMGRSRLHTPTVDDPFVIIVIDELASLTSPGYVSDPAARKRIAAALSLLLSQGRAVGVTVVGALQDPRKENLPFRDLFPTRIALRVAEVEHVKLVLGDGARDRGARCDQIPESLPGVGFVSVDGEAEPVRVRFTHLTDSDIAALAAEYAPGARIALPDPHVVEGVAA